MNTISQGTCLLLFVMGGILGVAATGQMERTAEMADRKEFNVVPTPERSELQKFAAWFNQDWQLLFPDLHQGAQMYVVGLRPERRKALKQELDEFLESHASAGERELLNAWLSLGAEGWDSKLKVRTTLKDFSAML